MWKHNETESETAKMVEFKIKAKSSYPVAWNDYRVFKSFTAI